VTPALQRSVKEFAIQRHLTVSHPTFTANGFTFTSEFSVYSPLIVRQRHLVAISPRL